MSKKCTKCGEEKPLSEFHFRKDRQKHYAACKACWYSKTRKWFNDNPGRAAEFSRAWVDRDKDHARAVYREMKSRQRAKPSRRFAMCFSTAVHASLSGLRKKRPTFKLLGYTREELVAHLQRQFLSGMSWDNYGQWHVDHIVPLSAFEIAGPLDPALRHAWALTNLRPLWAADNMRKKDKRVFLV